jgi:hypothetical protein
MFQRVLNQMINLTSTLSKHTPITREMPFVHFSNQWCVYIENIDTLFKIKSKCFVFLSFEIAKVHKK